ncbi:tRNA (adenosine(37)-N6)-threonylcarbamoyltransferase complex dimerization subunit type 1 TsaB [Vitellibacter sp. q18]|jgi:tRNA threonylcarbamoyladenosine biosynthesis protein TsaB|nr:tRNA (adenosine(37)-N6)-threonylcarbamoyltransferase complex dimerization subunit type 1 TsaB [Aequorivita lutea]
MATILCLETATTNCSVALAVDGEIRALREENNQKFSHAEKLHLFIESVLKEAQIPKENLQAVAISKGPGSYTGLRIGVSAAKGLCFALDLPLLATPTLHVLAQQIEDSCEFIVPLIDARRMEVYSAVFDAEKNQLRDTKAEILKEDSFLDYLSKGKTIFIGDGAAKFEAICTHENAVFRTSLVPSAREMAVLANRKYEKSDTENVAYFEPYYLKEFMLG